MTISPADVPALIVAEFPELQSDLDDETIRGLFHLAIGELALFTQLAKGRADWGVYSRALALANQFLVEGDGSVRNAAAVSFLEHIDFEGPRGKHAWTLLSPLQQRTSQQLATASGEPVPPWMR